MFKTVIFDWNGTLADSKAVVVESFKKVLGEVGCTVDSEFIGRRVGIGSRNILKAALKTEGILFNEEMLKKLISEKIEVELGLLEKVSLFDGSINLLNALNRRIQIALVTMSDKKVIEKLLEEKAIIHYFDVIISGDDVIQPKPNPEAYLKAANDMNARPEHCVVVEDSIFGVQASKAVRMRCIAISSGAYSFEELEKEKPDLVVHSIKEKNKMLDFIFKSKSC